MKERIFCYLLVFSVILVLCGLQAVAGERSKMLSSEVQQMEEVKGKLEAVEKMKQLEEVKEQVKPVEKMKQQAGEAIAEQKININTATVEELQNLPGLGSTVAEQIVDYRNEHGSFQKIEDIMQVKGLGEEAFDKIKHLITVGQ